MTAAIVILKKKSCGSLRCLQTKQYTAVSRKVDGKSGLDNPERYCGWFLLHCSSKKFERMAREATYICLRELMKSNAVTVVS